IFTPTESAAVASLYAICLSLIYEKTISPIKLFRIGLEVGKLSANILIVVASVSLFSWIISVEEIPLVVSEWVAGMELSRPAFLLAVNAVLLVSGCMLPTEVMLIVFVPIIMPVVLSFGIDPVHFGIIAIVNLMIGLNTPPFGLQLFVASAVLKVNIRDILKESWPMLVCLALVLLLITYVEPIVMYLPRTMG
ncbi:MAG: TRAP transporter large permease subunit, partial [Rhodospirillales bacterium]|nr:TRAP transporter large permease subunit [Rhodospirillales bacterium]